MKLHERKDAQALGDAEEVPLGAMTAALAGRVGGLDTLIIEVTETATTPLHIVAKGDRDETNFTRVSVIVRPGAHLDFSREPCRWCGFLIFPD